MATGGGRKLDLLNLSLGSGSCADIGGGGASQLRANPMAGLCEESSVLGSDK